MVRTKFTYKYINIYIFIYNEKNNMPQYDSKRRITYYRKNFIKSL